MTDITPPNFPLVSIITVVFNNAKHVGDTINSVLSQKYPNIEYIVIDGGSADGTVDVIKKYHNHISVFISEPDNGVYDALNKGVECSSGEIIGILHSGDLFCDENVVFDMVKRMSETKTEFCFADVVMVDEITGKIIRYYMAHYFNRWMFRMGWMPPHPATFMNKSLFDEFGLYSTKYKIVGDYDFFLRIFYGRKINWSYLGRITVKMRHGGISNSGLSSKKLLMNEINHALKANHIWSMPFLQLGRYFIRLMELIIRPKKSVCR